MLIAALSGVSYRQRNYRHTSNNQQRTRIERKMKRAKRREKRSIVTNNRNRASCKLVSPRIQVRCLRKHDKKNYSYQYAGLSAFQNVLMIAVELLGWKWEKSFKVRGRYFTSHGQTNIKTKAHRYYNSQTEPSTKMTRCAHFFLFFRSFSSVAVICMQNTAIIARGSRYYVFIPPRLPFYTFTNKTRLGCLQSFNITFNDFLSGWFFFVHFIWKVA